MPVWVIIPNFCKVKSPLYSTGNHSVRCGDLNGREIQGRGGIFVVEQKHTQHCKAAIVQSLSCFQFSEGPRTAAHQASLSSLFPRVCSNRSLLSRWCHSTISTSVAPFSSCSQSFPASGSFPMSWLFALVGQNIGASSSASVHPVNIQGRFPLGLTGLTSLLSGGPSSLFSSTTIWRHQFFGAQPSLCSNYTSIKK